MTRPAYWDHMSDAHAMRLHAAEAAVTDAIKRLGGHPDSQLEGEGGLAAAVAAERDAMRDRAITAEQERDRLRREVDALRDEMREWCHGLDTAACHRAVIYGPTIDRLDAILRGES